MRRCSCSCSTPGNLDNWDPALVDAIAAERVVLLDNTGVGGSTGVVPRTFTDMARDALGFVDAQDLKEIELLGYSIGGFVAQEMVLIRPQLVLRLVLAGTGPQLGRSYIQRIAPATSAPVQSSSATMNRARGKRRVVASRLVAWDWALAFISSPSTGCRPLGVTRFA